MLTAEVQTRYRMAFQIALALFEERWLAQGIMTPRSGRHWTARQLGAAALCAAVLVCAPAEADPPPYIADLVLHPSDSQVLALRYVGYGGGLLFSRDSAKTFRAVPSVAFYKYGLPANERIPLLFGADGKLLLGQADGLLVDDGSGCGIANAPALGDSWTAGIAAHPTDSGASFVVTRGDGKGQHAGLWKRDKEGRLSAFGLSEPAVAEAPRFFVSGLAVIGRAASAEGLRFIEVGTQFSGTEAGPPTSAPVLRLSDDLGASWTSFPIPDPGETVGVPRLLAVEPGEPLKLVVALDARNGDNDLVDPILLSVDGGRTFTPYLDQIRTAALATLLPSGRLLLGDSGEPGGLWSADTLGGALTKIEDFRVGCLGYQPLTQTLYLCKDRELGHYDLAMRSFCGIFQINDTAGFVACPAAPLAQNQDVVRNLCRGWCGPLHLASTPLCYAFDPGSGPCAAAVAYDQSANWTEPPGSEAAPRCPGFARASTDAGVGAPDAGAADAAGTDADAGGSVSDVDADVAQPRSNPDAARADAALPGRPEPDSRSKKSSCQLTIGATAGVNPSLLSLFTLALLVAARVSGRSVPRRPRR